MRCCGGIARTHNTYGRISGILDDTSSMMERTPWLPRLAPGLIINFTILVFARLEYQISAAYSCLEFLTTY